MPEANPVIVLVVPVPVEVNPTGFCVSVHVPVAGKLFNITLPVARAQVGWVIVPTAGVVGTAETIAVTSSRVVLSHEPTV